MRRTLRIGLALGLLAAAGAAGFLAWHAAGPARSGGLTLYGNVEIRDASLAFHGEGLVEAVRVEEGDRVEAGAVLAQLDTARLRAKLARGRARVEAQRAVLRRLERGTRGQEIEQARAEVAAAEARAANVARNVERLEHTTKAGASSERALDDARARLRVERATLEVRREALALALEGPRDEEVAEARARLEAQRETVRILERRLEDATLRAPASGVVQSRLLEPGEFASPGRPVLTLALTDPKWVRAYLPEPELGRVERGAAARVRSDSFPETAFEGWVGFIAPVAEFTPKRVETPELRTKLVYELRVYVEDPENRLRLGQPVTVELGEARGSASAARAERPRAGAAP